MLHSDGVEVYIKCLDRDEPYNEYTKPGNDEMIDNKIVERYISVSSGERYAIVVNVKGNYDFQEAEGVAIFISIDDVVMDEWEYHDAMDLEFDSIIEIDACERVVGDKWMNAGFAFGELILDHDLFDNPQVVEILATDLGRIRIEIIRGRRKRISSPSRWYMEQPAARRTGSKELIKNAGIAQNTRFILEGATEIKKVERKTSWIFESMDDSGNEDLVFIFRYRPRMTLQRLGMVPFSPIIIAAAGDVIEIDKINDLEAGPVLEVPVSTPPVPSLGVSTVNNTRSESLENSLTLNISSEVNTWKVMTRSRSEKLHTINGLTLDCPRKRRITAAENDMPQKVQRNAISTFQKPKLIEPDMEDSEHADPALHATIKDELKQDEVILSTLNQIPQAQTRNNLSTQINSPGTSTEPWVIDLTVDDLHEIRSPGVGKNAVKNEEDSLLLAARNVEEMEEEDLEREIRKIELQQRLSELRRNKVTTVEKARVKAE